MKHIRQSSQEHTTGSFNVTEDISVFSPVMYLGTEFNFPFCDISEELIPICCSSDPGNLKEDFSETPGIGSPGRYTTPGQTLPLYMDQASLHNDIRPELSEDSNYVGIAVHSKAMRVHTSLFQPFEEFQKLRFGIFR